MSRLRASLSPSFLHMKWVLDVILSLEGTKERTLPVTAYGQPFSRSIHTFAGRDSQKLSIFYFLGLSNTKDKLDPMLEEIEVSSDTRSSAWSQQAPNHARGFQS